jgi:hypothetical protein
MTRKMCMGKVGSEVYVRKQIFILSISDRAWKASQICSARRRRKSGCKDARPMKSQRCTVNHSSEQSYSSQGANLSHPHLQHQHPTLSIKIFCTCPMPRTLDLSGRCKGTDSMVEVENAIFSHSRSAICPERVMCRACSCIWCDSFCRLLPYGLRSERRYEVLLLSPGGP